MGCLAGHQISRPKPYAQRGVRACHDRSNRQSGVTAALATAQDAGSISEAERLSRHLTMGANEPAAPARLLQVGGAGGVVGKKSLKLWKRLWEPKIATLVNIHEHGRTLALVAVGHNRIGKLRTFARLADRRKRQRSATSIPRISTPRRPVSPTGVAPCQVSRCVARCSASASIRRTANFRLSKSRPLATVVSRDSHRSCAEGRLDETSASNKSLGVVSSAAQIRTSVWKSGWRAPRT